MDTGPLGTFRRSIARAICCPVGDAGGIAAGSQQLAFLAADTWGTTVVHGRAGVDYMTDLSGGHRAPIGAAGVCPCIGDVPTVVAMRGHAGAWSAVAAYDVVTQSSIGLVLDRDVAQDDLDSLLQELLAATRA